MLVIGQEAPTMEETPGPEIGEHSADAHLVMISW